MNKQVKLNPGRNPIKIMAVLLLMLSAMDGHSQWVPGELDQLRLLEPTHEIPKGLLSSRSAVYIHIPDKKGKYPTRGDWKSFATEAHEAFRRMGVDVVAYFNLDDINSGIDAVTGFTKPLYDRRINNLIFIRVTETVLGEEVAMMISQRADAYFLQIDHPTYIIKRNTLGEIMSQLGRDIYASKLPNSNFLIIDKPEFFIDTHVLKGRRFESFNTDLKIGKLAVPKFATYRIPLGVDSMTISADKIAVIQEYNRKADEANQRLAEIMSSYPFKYELIDYAVGEDHLYRMEFSYVLMFLHSTGETIKTLLNYDVDLNETDYITLKTGPGGVTSLHQYPNSTPVFKFYMKQLVSKEVYLGNQWDADLTWEEALINHLNNFKEMFKEKSN